MNLTIAYFKQVYVCHLLRLSILHTDVLVMSGVPRMYLQCCTYSGCTSYNDRRTPDVLFGCCTYSGRTPWVLYVPWAYLLSYWLYSALPFHGVRRTLNLLPGISRAPNVLPIASVVLWTYFLWYQSDSFIIWDAVLYIQWTCLKPSINRGIPSSAE